MKKLTDKLIAAVEDGQRAVLCTLMASSGSSPRGAGARMAVFEDGSTFGTVGGGQVEYIASKEALEVLKTGKTYLRHFGLSLDQVASIGMICGGNVDVYYQLIGKEELPVLYEMREALNEDVNSWIYMKISEGSVAEFRIIRQDEAADPELFTTKAVFRAGEPTIYADPLVRSGRTYIFGGGHVGQALVPVLASVGFKVCLFDSRDYLATPENFPAAEEVICGDYNHIDEKVNITENDFVVIMSPGHKSDFDLLKQVLRKKTRYVGCIGSRQKVAKTQEMLREAGIPEDVIQSVHSPIGLRIRAETPAEIAISIAGEMIKCRAETR